MKSKEKSSTKKRISIGYAQPKIKFNSDKIAEMTDSSSDFISNKIGIKSRSYLAKEDSSIDLMADAVNDLCTRYNCSIENVELVICVTQTPEYRIPQNSSLLCHKIGLGTSVASFDLSLGCSGFVYGLSVLLSMMHLHGYNSALLVTCDPYSRIMSSDDRATLPVFGDAAAATLISNNVGQSFVLKDADFGTDGSSAMELCVKAGGAKYPDTSIYGHQRYDITEKSLYMNGRSILEFMINRVPNSVHKCLSKNNMSFEEIDYFVFHQASKYMVELLQRKMNIPKEKVIIDIEQYGNTVSSTIPIALCGLFEKSDLCGKRVLICGFGVGLSWATNIIELDT